MERGAFSDKKVLEVVEGVIPVLVNCNWGKKFKDLSKAYDGGAYPTVVITDPEGNEVDRFVGVKTPDEVKTMIDSAVDQHTVMPEFVESYKEGLEQAKEEGKLALVFFTDGKRDCQITRASLADFDVQKQLKKYVLIRHVIEKKCETCKAFKITKGSNLRVLDPNAEDMVKKPLAKQGGKLDAKRLVSILRNTIKKWEKKKKDK